jgi:hypothetical protein
LKVSETTLVSSVVLAELKKVEEELQVANKNYAAALHAVQDQKSQGDKETYSRIGLLTCHGKLTVVLDYRLVMGNLQSYWTTDLSWETYSRIGLQTCHRKLTVVLDH